MLEIHRLARSSDWSKTSTSNLFKLLADLILPAGNRLPSSFHATAKELAAFGVGYQVTPSCPKDCCILKDEHVGKEQCPTCEEPIYDHAGRLLKVFRHICLTAAMQQMYQTRASAELMRAPDARQDVMHDIWGELHAAPASVHRHLGSTPNPAARCCLLRFGLAIRKLGWKCAVTNAVCRWSQSHRPQEKAPGVLCRPPQCFVGAVCGRLQPVQLWANKRDAVCPCGVQSPASGESPSIAWRHHSADGGHAQSVSVQWIPFRIYPNNRVSSMCPGAHPA